MERNQKEIKTMRNEEIRGAAYFVLKEESRKIVAVQKSRARTASSLLYWTNLEPPVLWLNSIVTRYLDK